MSEIVNLPPTASSFERMLGAHQLMATRCAACERLFLPPRAICPHCHGVIEEWFALSGRGTLASFTVIRVVPSAMAAAGFDRNHPYVSGIVNLVEGVSISARIIGVDAMSPDLGWIGKSLEVAWLDQGEGESRQTTLAFQPV